MASVVIATNYVIRAMMDRYATLVREIAPTVVMSAPVSPSVTGQIVYPAPMVII